MSEKGRKWAQAALSVLLVYHLFAIVLAPNSQTYLGYQAARWVEPYVNFFELVSSWNFFAPEPGPPPVFVEWEVLDRAGKRIDHDRMPDERDPFLLRERQNRRIAAARFMVYNEVRAERMMVSFLCGRDPRAFSVKLWRAVDTIPGLKEVRDGKRRIGDEEGRQRKWISHTFCDNRA